VQDYRDVMAIENTGLYKGLYHVLGGLISPMDGIGPGNLAIDTLVPKIAAGEVKEVILALNATMEGETTSFFVFKKLSPYSVTLSAIARGLAVGDELEYADEVTLGRSITNRVPFSSFFSVK
jgi:recombination protein RecR